MKRRSCSLFAAILTIAAGLATAQPVNSISPTGNLITVRQFHTATLVPNGKVLITGGFAVGNGPFASLNTAELYDPSTGSFAPAGTMTAMRHMHTATLLSNGKVLIAGGCLGNGGPGQSTAELYDPAAAAFSPTGSMTDAAAIIPPRC